MKKKLPSLPIKNVAFSSETTNKSYIPGTAHFTTLLSIFAIIFERVRKKIPCDDLRTPGIPAVLEVGIFQSLHFFFIKFVWKKPNLLKGDFIYLSDYVMFAG